MGYALEATMATQPSTLISLTKSCGVEIFSWVRWATCLLKWRVLVVRNQSGAALMAET